MGWQTLAYAGFGALVAHDSQERHELLHFQGVAHHHYEHAEDLHEDDSVASTVHALTEASQFSPALPSPQVSSPSLSSTALASVTCILFRAQSHPDGLDRPPKPRA